MLNKLYIATAPRRPLLLLQRRQRGIDRVMLIAGGKLDQQSLPIIFRRGEIVLLRR